jgi:AraC-like DNA-binding protein
MIKIPRRRLLAHAGRAVYFAPRPAELRGADGFVGYVAHLCRDLASERGLAAHDGLRREMEDLLLSALLAAHPHEEGADLEPAYLHRAEAHIRAHLSRGVGLPELVAVTGASERALQAAFRRYRNCSPLDFSRDIRLECARAALLEGAGVTEAALEFGFSHFGRFARSYAARFREKPSQTVRKARH